MAILAVLWIGVRERGVSPWTFLHRDSLEANVLDVLLGVAVALLLTLAWRVAHQFVESVRALEEILAQHIGSLPPDRLLAVALLSGFAEELMFRGALMGSVGLWWSSLIFGLCHLGPVREARLWAVYAVLVGLGFGLMVTWRGVLLPAIVAHCVVNALGLARLSRSSASPGS